MRIKVKVFGASSLIVDGVDAVEIFKAIDYHLGITMARGVKILRRGAPKKVKPTNPLISEGEAVPQ